MIDIKKEDNGHKGRFTIYDNERYGGEMTYTAAGDKLLIIDFTHIEQEFAETDLAEKLLTEVVEHAREKNVKVIPLCPVAQALFDKYPSLTDVLRTQN